MAASASRYARWRADLSRDGQPGGWSQSDEAKARRRYTALKNDLTRAPDGSYPTEMHDDGIRTDLESNNKAAPPLEVNNPLSLSDKNPWHTYFASLSMLDQIKVDVQRAFPEDVVLRSEVAQQQLIRVLFVWSLMEDNESVGYRQGMHEIAAICWLVRKDAQQASSQEDSCVEEDTFILFELIMARAKPWYEWKSQAKFPISKRCDAIQALLSSTDAQLARHLEAVGIETQLFAIRWVRLIFTREVWDALFSLDPSLELIDAICVAMLIRIRTQLLNSDYSSSFQALLNYPSYAVDCPPITLVKQAQQIHASPNQLTLMSLIQENEEMLQIPIISKQDTSTYQSSTYTYPSSVPPSLSHLTRGVYAQTLSAGLGRALQNVQKTVNAAYMSHSASNGGSDGFPPLIESIHRAPLMTSRDATAELQEVKQRDRSIGESLVRVIDVLEKHWSEVLNVDEEKKDKDATRSDLDFLLCLTTLKHSRDVLMGHTADFDSSIMDGPKAAEKADELKERDKTDDHKGRDFGQRFKRTVEVAIASPPSPSAPFTSPTASKTAPPATVSSPPFSAYKAYSPRPREPQLKREPVNDPLGVAIR